MRETVRNNYEFNLPIKKKKKKKRHNIYYIIICDFKYKLIFSNFDVMATQLINLLFKLYCSHVYFAYKNTIKYYIKTK